MKDIPLKMNRHKNSKIDNSPSIYMTHIYYIEASNPNDGTPKLSTTLSLQLC